METNAFDLMDLYNLTVRLKSKLFEPMMYQFNKISNEIERKSEIETEIETEMESKKCEMEKNEVSLDDCFTRIYIGRGLHYELEKWPQLFKFFQLFNFQHYAFVSPSEPQAQAQQQSKAKTTTKSTKQNTKDQKIEKVEKPKKSQLIKPEKSITAKLTAETIERKASINRNTVIDPGAWHIFSPETIAEGKHKSEKIATDGPLNYMREYVDDINLTDYSDPYLVYTGKVTQFPKLIQSAIDCVAILQEQMIERVWQLIEVRQATDTYPDSKRVFINENSFVNIIEKIEKSVDIFEDGYDISLQYLVKMDYAMALNHNKIAWEEIHTDGINTEKTDDDVLNTKHVVCVLKQMRKFATNVTLSPTIDSINKEIKINDPKFLFSIGSFDGVIDFFIAVGYDIDMKHKVLTYNFSNDDVETNIENFAIALTELYNFINVKKQFKIEEHTVLGDAAVPSTSPATKVFEFKYKIAWLLFFLFFWFFF